VAAADRLADNIPNFTLHHFQKL